MKTILVDAVNTFVVKWKWINIEMQKMLDQFENKKIILTNANQEEKIKFWLIDLPYDLFSLEHNPNKPDSEYYRIFLDKYNLKTDDVIYFEHNIEAVESARSVWIKTYHYDKNKKDLISLEKFLREIN